MIKVAFLTTDNREQQNKYHLEQPFFGTAPSAVLDGFAAMPEDIEVHVVSCSKREMVSPGKLAPNIHFHQPIVPHIGWGRTAFAGCALAVRKVLKDLQPDIVHGQGTERDCAISAVYSGFPNVLTIHGNMQRIYLMRLLGANAYYWLASTLESHALARTGGVLCNSRHTRSLVEKRTRKTWLVPNPLRPAFLESPAAGARDNPLPVFLVIGVVTRLKRPLEILQSMRALHQAGHRFLIRFIGSRPPDNDYGARFQELLDQAAAEGYAEHLGVLDEDSLIRTMDQADALIHFPEEEAFGLVVAEALARGLKVFASDVGGIPDITGNVPSAEIRGRIGELAGSIAAWLTGGAPRTQEQGTALRAIYHPDAVARRHLGIYREILS
jgi:glycosyltransferase involved in cell wall biosynthesis